MNTNALPAKRSSLKANVARAAVVAASVGLVGGVIVTQSKAAFNTTTTNSGNAFNAATIDLSGANTTAMFNVPAMVPGDTATGCVDVTYTGTADPGPVKIYPNAYSESDGAADGATLDDALTFQINRVTSCASPTTPTVVHAGITLSTLRSTSTDYSNGLSAQWNPVPTPPVVSYGYNFTATFTPSGSTATDNTRIGDTVTSLSFTWETQAGA